MPDHKGRSIMNQTNKEQLPKIKFGIFQRILIAFLFLSLVPLIIVGYFATNNIEHLGNEAIKNAENMGKSNIKLATNIGEIIMVDELLKKLEIEELVPAQVCRSVVSEDKS